MVFWDGVLDSMLLAFHGVGGKHTIVHTDTRLYAALILARGVAFS